MTPRRRLEDVLAALREAKETPGAEASLAVLRDALAGPYAPAAARAARIVGEAALTALVPDLLAAFDRYLAKPASDPGCAAKTAIAVALDRLDHDDPEAFLRGIRHVQMEGAYGGAVDGASDLRAACALGLARTRHPDVLGELVERLADSQPTVRAAAARAVAGHGDDAGAPVLRLKVLVGDAEPGVVAECLRGLLLLAPRQSLGFVARRLHAADLETVEAAALALGESRLPEAFDVLRAWGERQARGGRRRLAFVALAALRREEALAYLLSTIRDGPVSAARQAIEALAPYKDERALCHRIEEAAGSRSEPQVQEAVRRAFGVPTG
jgi:hypothetical protein